MGMLVIHQLLMLLRLVVSGLGVHGSGGIATLPTNSLSFAWKKYGRILDKPQNRAFHRSLTTSQIISATGAPSPYNTQTSSRIAVPPTIPYHRHYPTRNKKAVHQPSYFVHPLAHGLEGPSLSPSYPPLISQVAVGPALSSAAPENQVRKPILPPAVSPLRSSSFQPRTYPPLPAPTKVFSLPLAPPNEDCASTTCMEPLTYTPSSSPCGCVWPIQVRMSLGIALYTFFPLVSELANEIAAALSLYPPQVRVMGANAVDQQPEKTAVLINLVPLGGNFDSSTAFTTYKKFWSKKLNINPAVFGAYDVLYVKYPGLPKSPPLRASSIYDGGHGGNGMPIKPLGVDVPKKMIGGRAGVGGHKIAIIVLASTIACVACMGIVWLFLLKSGALSEDSKQMVTDIIHMPRKPIVTPGSRTASASTLLVSSMQSFAGSAKTFNIKDIERATANFDASRILGEGGFGLVYRGILDDGRKVAVKVLKRDDQHGSREFLAEVEMLSRLHHRNLVILIGICIENHIRCLVYELVPNGSVESHLHGVDRETDPLDWGARMKIAFGAARGLAYLHEDSSPCVIHRDFKASNILLEHDFTPKVSDFGLARTGLDEQNKHISTHVMGTFGYLAPEYAMTGHLLVKSDVYSYGVVLLELLTGRKPVDLSQPPGQENLVAWARPLLTSKDGLEIIVDPAIRSNATMDSMAKVAAIASMCVQPEVSFRPFMGEVVQALKLVCEEFEEKKEEGSRTGMEIGWVSGNFVEFSPEHHFDAAQAKSETDFGIGAVQLEGRDMSSFDKRFISGPSKTKRRGEFWQRLRRLSSSRGSENGFAFKC